ncbi:MAG: hypothetical protein O3A63_06875 [Proteobacteria bacterium]|nr:hypothetical protein [Pseudomonadota bacterium]
MSEDNPDAVEDTVEVGTRSIQRLLEDSDRHATLIWPFDIKIAPSADPVTIVLRKNGRPHARFPLLGFEITEGPPGYNFDIQLVPVRIRTKRNRERKLRLFSTFETPVMKDRTARVPGISR